MDSEVKIGNTSVSRETSVGTVINKEERDMGSFFQEVSKIALTDTGLLPLSGSGVLAIRQALDHTQIVFQHAPGLYYVNWGAYERDKNAKTYYLSQPWRIVIGDLKDGQLLGARTFYSPTPVQTLDQQMYHVNLPNINCRGYGGGNGVGWICLYHTQDWSSYSLGEKIRALVERASGVETYNDANMSNTDGPRFYQAKGAPSYMVNPTEWQKKSQKEGFEWILDADLLIPVLVKGIDDQTMHTDGGQPLTLEMAMYGNYAAYYSDKYLPKPINAFARTDLPDPTPESIGIQFNAAFQKSVALGSKAVKKAPAPEANTGYTVPEAAPIPVVPTCDCCEEELDEEAGNFIVNVGLPSIDSLCEKCLGECYMYCDSCHALKYADDIQILGEDEDSQHICKSCDVLINCNKCGAQYLQSTLLPVANGIAPFVIEMGKSCWQCDTAGSCNLCHGIFSEGSLKEVEAKNPLTGEDASLVLCQTCIESSTICGCGYIKKIDDTGLLGDGVHACAPCIAYKNDGCPYFEPTQVSVKL